MVTNCNQEPELQNPIKDPAGFTWHEASKIQHYWPEVNAMTRPMTVRDEPAPYGEDET